jgi:hypothetical protein
VEEMMPSDVRELQAGSTDPVADTALSIEVTRIQEELFATAQKDAHLDADDSSHNTLEELKMMFIEEARTSPTVEAHTLSHQKVIEEEKKEEVIDDEFLQLHSGRNLFSQADEVFDLIVEGKILQTESEQAAKFAVAEFNADFDEMKVETAEQTKADEGQGDEIFAVHPNVMNKVRVEKERRMESSSGEEIEVTDCEVAQPLAHDVFHVIVEDFGDPHSMSSPEQTRLIDQEPLSLMEKSYEDFAAIVTVQFQDITLDDEAESSGEEVEEQENDATAFSIPEEIDEGSGVLQDPADVVTDESEAAGATASGKLAAFAMKTTQQVTKDDDEEISEQIEVTRTEDAASSGSVLITASSGSSMSQHPTLEEAAQHAADDVAGGEIEVNDVDLSALTTETGPSEPIRQVHASAEYRDEPPNSPARYTGKQEADKKIQPAISPTRSTGRSEVTKKKKPGVFKGLLRPFAKKKSAQKVKGVSPVRKLPSPAHFNNKPVLADRASIQKSQMGKKSELRPSSDINMLMESHLSKKFEQRSGGVNSRLAGELGASPERPYTRGRKANSPTPSPFDIDLYSDVPQLNTNKQGSPSRIVNDLERIAPQDSSGRWGSFFDANEGFELNMWPSVQTSTERGSTLERSTETPEKKLRSAPKAAAASPQKVADFPLVAVGSQASF